MKKSFTTTLVLTVATLAAAQVMAQTSPAMDNTNDAPAEVDQTRSSRNDPSSQSYRSQTAPDMAPNSDRMRNDGYSNRYSTRPVAQGKTRAQVQAELFEAQRTGDIPLGNNFGGPAALGIGPSGGSLLKDVYPNRYSSY